MTPWRPASRAIQLNPLAGFRGLNSKLTFSYFASFFSSIPLGFGEFTISPIFMDKSTSDGFPPFTVRIPPTGPRTSTTKQLQEYANKFKCPILYDTSKLRRMRDSYTEIVLPFSTDENLREEYTNVYGGIRFGKIIEDIDALAGSISYKHCIQPMEKTEPAATLITTKQFDLDGEYGDHLSPLHSCNVDTFSWNVNTLPIIIVTASADRIDLNHPLSVKEDLRLSGCVSFVGNSSMEVLMAIDKGCHHTSSWSHAATALFTMVARHPKKHEAVSVPKLALESEEEKLLFSSSAKRRETRRNRTASISTSLTIEELQYLHHMLLESSSTPNNNIPTGASSLRLCHPQERNIHNFMFGGWLMKEAFELAFCVASLSCQGRPIFVSLDESSFLIPIPIGSLLSIDAKVVYVEQPNLVVQVTIELVDPSTLSKKIASTFRFTFEKRGTVSPADKLPTFTSYQEALRYMLIRRQYQENKKELSSGTFQWGSLLRTVTNTT